MHALHARYERNHDAVSRKIEGEVIIVPIRSGVGDLNSLCTLKPVGSVLWDFMNESHTIPEIVQRVCDEFEVTAKQTPSVGNGAASDGASIYSGDYLSTGDNGSLLVRVGPMSVELQASSALHIHSAPYGAVIELNRGSVIYTTSGGKENLVIVASDVRVTPDPSLPELGRVTIDNLCEITVYSQRGPANAKVGRESHLVEEGKAYRVRAESKISYRE